MVTATKNRRYTGWNDERLQKRILALIDQRGHEGLTVKELRLIIPDTEAHHGWISGACSMLHAKNKIARLRGQKRHGYKVYVELDFIDSRPCEAQGYQRKALSIEEQAWYDDLVETFEYWMSVDTEGARFKTDQVRAQRHPVLFANTMLRLWRQRPDES